MTKCNRCGKCCKVWYSQATVKLEELEESLLFFRARGFKAYSKQCYSNHTIYLEAPLVCPHLVVRTDPGSDKSEEHSCALWGTDKFPETCWDYGKKMEHSCWKVPKGCAFEEGNQVMDFE